MLSIGTDNGLRSSVPFAGPSAGRAAALRRLPATSFIEFTIGDITRETADAIVNPVGPGLVDLAVRQAAGPELLDAFHLATGHLPEGRLGAGQAVVTPGFGLPVGHVIHCGPPVYADDPEKARQDLVACHVEVLRQARAHGFTSVAIPAIGTGVYRYPVAEAADVAVDAVTSELRTYGVPLRVRFVLPSQALLAAYAGAQRR
jgi:O-acetyl-ADP-ribose deacetylase (regulator of RNase III)